MTARAVRFSATLVALMIRPVLNDDSSPSVPPESYRVLVIVVPCQGRPFRRLNRCPACRRLRSLGYAA